MEGIQKGHLQMNISMCGSKHSCDGISKKLSYTNHMSIYKF